MKSQKKSTEEERNLKNYKNKSKTINKMAIRTYISIIILNVNGINAPIKRHRAAEWIQKQDPHTCCLQETHLRSKYTQTESEGMEKGIPCKWKSKESLRSNTYIRQNRL